MILACLGNSITEGYLVPQSHSWPSVLEQISSFQIKTINFGISGDTTFDAIKRLEPVISSNASELFIELGINDFFMGFPIKSVKENLRKIITSALKEDMDVILAGFSFKAQGSTKWKKMYEELAHEYYIHLYPNIFKGLARCDSCFLPDGIHPNSKGYGIIAKNIFYFLKTLNLT